MKQQTIEVGDVVKARRHEHAPFTRVTVIGTNWNGIWCVTDDGVDFHAIWRDCLRRKQLQRVDPGPKTMS